MASARSMPSSSVPRRRVSIRAAGALIVLALATTARAADPKTTHSGESARYVCADGRAIEVLYGGGVVVVTVGGATTEMARAPSADGERYVGGGWQWWGKGRRNGMLARLPSGETVASGGTSCRAP